MTPISTLNRLTHRIAKEMAKAQGTPRQPHLSYSEIKNHPKCETVGCRNRKTVLDWHWTSGAPVYRPVCNNCHRDRIATKNGFKTHSDFLNSKHPYRKHRKNYCENKDGRLGHKCRATIHIDAQLEVDHINGNPDDNRPQNLQTLCANCHKFKTHANKDYATPGRKTIKRKRTK